MVQGATDEYDGGVKLVLVEIGGTGQKDKGGDKIKTILQTLAEQPWVGISLAGVVVDVDVLDV